MSVNYFGVRSRRMPTPVKALLLLLMINVASVTVAQDWVWAPDFPEGSNIPPIAAQDQDGDVRTLCRWRHQIQVCGRRLPRAPGFQPGAGSGGESVGFDFC